jgi:hypothetical protein
VFSPEDLARFPGFEGEQVPGKVEDVHKAIEDRETNSGGPGSPGHTTVTREVPATYSELDVNAHVNNAEFLRWAFSLVPPGALETSPATEIDINFLSELRQGQAMSLTALFTDRDALVGGVADEESVFRCRIRF